MTYEAVKTAADDLVKNGRKVTLAALRDEVGGAMETLTEMRDLWASDNGTEQPLYRKPKARINAEMAEGVAMAVLQENARLRSENALLRQEVSARSDEIIALLRSQLARVES